MKHPVFMQVFHPECDKDWMVGTDENPVYQMGWTNGVENDGFDSYYPKSIAASAPGIYTPRSLKCERVNIQIGEMYFRGILAPKESATFTYGTDWYRIHFTFREE